MTSTANTSADPAARRSRLIALERAARFVAEAFPPGTPPRSLEYKLGMRAWFMFSLTGEAIATACKFAEGTVEFDAFFAGVDAGQIIARRQIAE